MVNNHFNFIARISAILHSIIKLRVPSNEDFALHQRCAGARGKGFVPIGAICSNIRFEVSLHHGFRRVDVDTYL